MRLGSFATKCNRSFASPRRTRHRVESNRGKALLMGQCQRILSRFADRDLCCIDYRACRTKLRNELIELGGLGLMAACVALRSSR